MRLQPDDVATISTALEAGITLFDTARAYDLGANERLLARAIPRGTDARVVTKGGMARPDGAWVPDGRAKTIRGDCEASLEALDGLPIDLWLLHAPDLRTPWRTSLRALARLKGDGLVRGVGVCNVNRRQLDEALDIAGVSAVQNALSVLDDTSLRSGVVERCEDENITFLAHSPLGGPRRVRGLAKRPELQGIARTHDATEAEVAIAWLLSLSPVVVPIPGARRPEAVRSIARAARISLTESERDALGTHRRANRAARKQTANEVVVIMGIPGAGKSRLAKGYVSRGYVRLNRDERGGTLRDIADALENELSESRSVVLDNTYLTRASRSYVLDAAHRHGARARCVWLDTSLQDAQINMIERILDVHERLPSPDELKALAKTHPGIHTPTTQMRTVRELEPPSEDEGWDQVERVSFVRAPSDGTGEAVFVAASAVKSGFESDVPVLVFDWDPDGSEDAMMRAVERLVPVVTAEIEGAVCRHPGGPPTCWCRPPLPGLILSFARGAGVDPARSTLIGSSSAHKTLANALGARYVSS